MPQPVPDIEESSRFNFITSIWIVPFVALLIAGWLAFQYFSQLGEEVTIIFPKNEGLQAGQSQIKYKDVPIGTIKKIELQKDGEGVEITARMEKQATRYLNENTKFWIVKPEVGVSGVSGLETLISGTYINMYAQEGEKPARSFVGLKQPYRQTEDGGYFMLRAPSGYNIKKGTPILFKSLEAGQVEYVHIALDGQSIEFVVYIEKDFIPYIHTDSKFWVTSTVDIDFSNGRLDINLAPATNLIQGGIEFSSSGEDANDTVPENYVFRLFKTAAAAEGMNLGRGGKYLKTLQMFTDEPIAKLKKGAPVKFEGYEVGRVKNIKLSYASKEHKVQGTILVEIDTSSLANRDDNVTVCENNLYRAIEEGLKAKITPIDPITGMLYIDLLFDQNATKQILDRNGEYVVLPTIKGGGAGVMDELQKLLASLNQIAEENRKPLHSALTDLQKILQDVSKLTAKSSFKDMPNGIDKNLKELEKTLKTAREVLKGYDDQSLMTHQIAQTLKDVTEASNELKEFLKMLNRKPNSLIFGDK
ncbi:MAG: MCE family protein [Campylobacterales bacterium]|nr:MCE family protein [Campylobacterales bacterium]